MGRNSDLMCSGMNSGSAKDSNLGVDSTSVPHVRIVVADDQQVVLEGIKKILASFREFEIVGEARDGKRAVELVRDLEPDILLIEVAMPVMNGIDVAQTVREECPATKVIFFTMHSDREYIRKALQAKMSGYILKDDANSDLAQAIKVAASGATYFSHAFVEILADYVMELEKRVGCEDPYGRLSAREREVFRLLADGKSIKEIAELLYISPKTVESHKYNILKKMEINSISELIRYAIRKNIIKP